MNSILIHFCKQKMVFLTMYKIFVLDNFSFVRADGWGIRLILHSGNLISGRFTIADSTWANFKLSYFGLNQLYIAKLSKIWKFGVIFNILAKKNVKNWCDSPEKAILEISSFLPSPKWFTAIFGQNATFHFSTKPIRFVCVL